VYAISLWQPWASFISAELKPFETRAWKPPKWLIGKRIAIHAAKKIPDRVDREWAAHHRLSEIPFGAVVCTAILRGAYQMPTEDENFGALVQGSPKLAAIRIDEFGDYSPGRWAWWLTDIERFEPPIPARGSRGFFEWNRDG